MSLENQRKQTPCETFKNVNTCSCIISWPKGHNERRIVTLCRLRLTIRQCMANVRFALQILLCFLSWSITFTPTALFGVTAHMPLTRSKKLTICKNLPVLP